MVWPFYLVSNANEQYTTVTRCLLLIAQVPFLWKNDRNAIAHSVLLVSKNVREQGALRI